MTKAVLRKKIHAAIDKLQDEKLLNMIHVVLENSLEEDDDDLTPEQKAELDAVIHSWNTGKGKAYPWEEVKANIINKHKRKLLNSFSSCP